ncbi:hypothetical protein HYR99_40865 [Candidatus Poribacteria bacterium]|nr:hypothetical protein [Candidatus Poribacteria bacterium]
MTAEFQPETESIDHDGLFKELLHQCFELFLRLFYPQQAAQLDFSQFTFLEQERLTDYPTGEHRHVDTLIEISTRLGKLMWIHIEFQSARKSGFPLRMFRYFSQLRLRGDMLIWQIVLYMPAGCGGVGFEGYTETVFEETFLPFRYWCIGLGDLEAVVYLATENPVAYGLAPLMKHGEISNPRLKALCLNGLATSHITPAQVALLACFVETYLPLTQTEEEEFEQLIQREEVKVMEFITSWERKGREQGRAEETLRSRRDTLLELLQEKFGSIPETAVQRVEVISSVEELRRLLKQLVHASSLAEMGLDGVKQ